MAVAAQRGDVVQVVVMHCSRLNRSSYGSGEPYQDEILSIHFCGKVKARTKLVHACICKLAAAEETKEGKGKRCLNL